MNKLSKKAESENESVRVKLMNRTRSKDVNGRPCHNKYAQRRFQNLIKQSQGSSRFLRFKG
jgi:hypothetical protein